MGHMIQLNVDERTARYIRFAVQNDLEVMSNGDFNDEDDAESRAAAEGTIAMIDSALALCTETPPARRGRSK